MSRKEFEVAIVDRLVKAMPAGSYVSDHLAMYPEAHKNAGEYITPAVQWAWIGWQDSRSSISTPGPMAEYPDDNHGEYGKGWNDCHREFAAAIGIDQ